MAISFHRSIFPWILVIVFLALAPVLIFFTTGYRWNPKKEKVERTGTVILDSIPYGASVKVDGRKINETTPVTLQSVSLGFHLFEVSKPEYRLWKKRLEVRAERVTFANTIQLWKTSQPSLFSRDAATFLSVSPNDQILLSLQHTTPTTAIITDQLTQKKWTIRFSKPLALPIQIFWSSNSRFALLESEDGSAWVVDATTQRAPLALPPARYRWLRSILVGNDGRALLRLQVQTNTLRREQLPPGALDQLDGAELRQTTSTQDMIFVTDDRPQEGLILPRGRWTFWSSAQGVTLLRDGSRWLALSRSPQASQARVAAGFLRRSVEREKRDTFLLLNHGEVWMWEPMKDPELLYRQSEPIRAAVWHRRGNDLFIATRSEVFALNLDDRDGRLITPLATFEGIQDMVLLENTLLIAGTRDGTQGLWNLEL